MATSKCLLVVLSLIFLNLVNGLTFWEELLEKYPESQTDNEELSGTDNEELPGTIDEVLVKTAGKAITFNTGRAGSDKISDGLDMMLTKEQHDRLFSGSRGRSGEPLFITWTNNVVPYELIPGHFQSHHESKIQEAVDVWQSLTCLKFRNATASDKNKIQLFNGEGCWSELGMAKEARSQLLSLQATGCFWRGTVAHEFGHAIGLVHEHQRPNRDDYLRIIEENIQPNYLSQLKMYLPTAVSKLGLGYDYYSVMHYGQHAFAYDPRLQTLYAYDRRTGQRRPDITKGLGKVLGPSYTDVKLVNMMYNCDAHCRTKPACRADCFVDKNCRCFCKEQMQQPPCRDHLSNCQQRAANNECLTQRFNMEIYCRKTCQMCAIENGLPPEEVPDQVVQCIDLNQNCDYWAKVGECTNNPDYMLTNCRKSCQRCGGTTTNCRNDNVNCDNWAKYGECQRNPSYMLSYCKKACNAC